MTKRTIALLTDFGLDDNYVGIMKGVILKINPDVHLVDITHSIDPQNIFQGALTLKTAYSYFPSKTIFVAVVDPGVGSSRQPILVKTKDHFFIGPDNGLLSLALKGQKSKEIYTITNDQYFLKPVSQTFHGRDIFAPVAAYLSKAMPSSKFGRKQHRMINLSWQSPRIDQKNKSIIGKIIDIDRFGNLTTNVEQNHLKGTISVKIKNNVIQELSSSYAKVSKGNLLVIFGSKGYLEIAVNQGSAEKKLKAKIGDSIKIVQKSQKSKKILKQSDLYQEFMDQ